MEPSDLSRRSVNSTAFALLIFAVLLSGYLLFQSTLFSVGSVAVQGNRSLDQDEILRIAGVGTRINIFRLDVDTIRSRLTQDLRIADADVKRHFPGAILITVRERQPAAYMPTSYGFAQLDGDGTILAVVKTIRRMDVPLITGHSLGNAYVGERVEAPAVRAVLTYLSCLSESAFNQISEVTIQSSGHLVGYTTHAARIKLGGLERLAEKAASTSEIITEADNKLAIIDYIDLSYTTPYVKFRKNEEER